MAMTLEELKAENAKAESEAETENVDQEADDLSPPQADEEEAESETAEDEQEETTEDAESEEEDTGEADAEDWMQGDGHESQDAEKKFTDGDIGKAKAKLRAKLEKRHESEIDQLRNEIAELKGKPKAEGLTRPKREDFFDADDPDQAYESAYEDYLSQKLRAEAQAEQATTATQQQQQEYQQATAKAVDQHYERAVELATKSGISAEVYQSADLRVRQTVESIFPDGGDVITDALIANLGEGSEKVMYNLGINTARREKFADLLREDRTGIKAAMYLAERKAELMAPQKRTTKAPKPAPNVKGDKNAGTSHRALKKRYEEAHKAGNTQAAFNAKREAKKDGADTSNW